MSNMEYRQLGSSAAPHHHIKPLYTEEEIRRRVTELGQEIAKDLSNKDPVFISVLKGSFIFLADLVRTLDFPVSTEFIRVSSYGDRVVTSGEVKVELDLATTIANRHVLLVEDIIDTGITVDYLCALLNARKPASMRVCTLLHKPSNTVKVNPIDYAGFEVPNQFVVGYGLDYHGYHRNLPFVGAIEEVS